MRVTFGNVAPKTGSVTPVDPDAFTLKDLRKKAQVAGILTDGNKIDLAARLSAVVTYTQLPGTRVTIVELAEGVSLSEALATIAGPAGIWSHHSDAPPAWVECESDGLEALLAEEFGCARGAPANLEDTHYTFAGPPGVGPAEEETPE